MTPDGGDRPLGAPRFDVVLRGYDRRQVDEHVGRLQRVLARMRADLDAARSQPLPAVPPHPAQGPPPMGRPGYPGPAGRPPGMPRPGEAPDAINHLSDRMQSILQAAEEEAEEIRAAARKEVRAEGEAARAELAEMRRQRDAVVAELTRLRGQLEGLLAAPTARFPVTQQPAPPRTGDAGDARPRPSPRPKPSPNPATRTAPPPTAADETTALRPSDATQIAELFRPSDKPGADHPAERGRGAASANESVTTVVPIAEFGKPSTSADKPRNGTSPQHGQAPRSGEPAEQPSGSKGQPSARSGDTGSDEKSAVKAGRPAGDTPGNLTAKPAAPTHSAGEPDVEQTMQVGAVRPATIGPNGTSSGSNGRSGGGDRHTPERAGTDRPSSSSSSGSASVPAERDGAGRAGIPASGSRSG